MAVRVVLGPRRTPLGRLCPELRAPGNHREREIMMARHHSPGQSWSHRLARAARQEKLRKSTARNAFSRSPEARLSTRDPGCVSNQLRRLAD